MQPISRPSLNLNLSEKAKSDVAEALQNTKDYGNKGEAAAEKAEAAARKAESAAKKAEKAFEPHLKK